MQGGGANKQEMVPAVRVRGAYTSLSYVSAFSKKRGGGPEGAGWWRAQTNNVCLDHAYSLFFVSPLFIHISVCLAWGLNVALMTHTSIKGMRGAPVSFPHFAFAFLFPICAVRVRWVTPSSRVGGAHSWVRSLGCRRGTLP